MIYPIKSQRATATEDRARVCVVSRRDHYKRGRKCLKHLIGPDPGHAVETANGPHPNLIERRVGEVQVRERTLRAAVGDGHGDRLALVCRKNEISDIQSNGYEHVAHRSP